MTISEIKKDKENMESEIEKLILDFDKKYSDKGIYIDSVCAKFEILGGHGGLPTTKTCHITTKIDIHLW